MLTSGMSSFAILALQCHGLKWKGITENRGKVLFQKYSAIFSFHCLPFFVSLEHQMDNPITVVMGQDLVIENTHKDIKKALL